MRSARRLTALGILAVAITSTAQEPGATTLGPDAEAVIHYDAAEGRRDAVAALETRLAAGTAHLEFAPPHGYLGAVLRELGISPASQSLVFSKTSSQRDRMGPRTPRAVYFNDEAAVGWVPDGTVLEVAAMDPERGLLFYTLAQTPAEPPRFRRGTDCRQCHLDRRTVGVPGWLVRSMYTAPDGTALGKVPGFVNGHNSPLTERWGGWFVTGGTAAGDEHLGNRFFQDGPPGQMPIPLPAGGADAPALPGVGGAGPAYLAPGSDVVALLVLEHQTKMLNLLIHAGYEARLARAAAANTPGDGNPRWRDAAEMLLEYLLFRNEATLHGPVTGDPAFAAGFVGHGPVDRHGRSLRQFDLRTRLFRYPCSYLIYSPAFDALPEELRSYLWRRLAEILAGRDPGAGFAILTPAERQAVGEILRDTKPEFARLVQSAARPPGEK